MHLVKHDPSPSEVRTFGLVVCCGFVVIGGLLWWLGRGEDARWAWVGSARQWTGVVLWAAGVLVLLLTLVSHRIGRPVYVGWMTGAGYLGIVMTFILLSVLFVVLLPIFSLIRFQDPLRMKPARPGESCWENHRHHEGTLTRMARPF